jgi:hypothetical protein
MGDNIHGETILLRLSTDKITNHPDRDTILKLRNTAISAAIIMLFIALMLFANR